MLTLAPLPTGPASAPATLQAMRAVVHQALTRAPVWTVTAHALQGVGGHSVDRAAALARFLRSHFTYVHDPTSMELLTDPTLHALGMLDHGMTYGDCDDAAMLAGAMGRAAGLPAQLVAVGYRRTGPLAHVYATLRTAAGWANMDVTLPPQGPAPVPRQRMEVRL